MDFSIPTSTPEELASQASLRYVSDTTPGLYRKRRGEGFIYYDLHNEEIKDSKVLDRIHNLRIPPAWEDVWICPLTYGHIQATGRDEKRRKQYIYHVRWSEIASQTKFNKMTDFSEVLPRLRERITLDMNMTGLKFEKVLATIVWLLDKTYIRIGNEEYAKDNSHFGLTTLRSRHVDIHGNTVSFVFTGKSGKDHIVEISNPKITKTIKKLDALPGYELFKYIDDAGHKHTIDSQDVNEYIREIVKDNVTAKEFRTWGGTVLAGTTLRKIGDYVTKNDLKHNLSQAVRDVAKSLGNTPTVCRGYYVHPVILKSYEEKILIPHFEQINRSEIRGLNKDEYATSTLLKLNVTQTLNT